MPRVPQDCQRKCWVFTLNNYSDEELRAIKSWCTASCQYCVIGEEVGESGTPHLQGYLRTKKKCRLSQIKDYVSRRAHFEAARGSDIDNRDYCSKEGRVWSFGRCRGKDSKSRDELALEYSACFNSRELGKFIDDNPGVYAWSGHTLLRNQLAGRPAIERPDINVEWIWGPPGVGKSRLAHERYPNGYVKEPRTKWWTGYKLESDIIIDDFGPRGIDLNHLLRWFDRYRCYVETKGDMVPLYGVNWIVTSNFSPEGCFQDEAGRVHDQMPALLRRIKVIYMGVRVNDLPTQVGNALQAVRSVSPSVRSVSPSVNEV